MQAILAALEGNGSSRAIELPSGKVIRVGRNAGAEFAFPDDPYMSSLHFAVGYRDGKCYISNLSQSQGTFVDGAQVEKGMLREGAQILAGQTRFHVSMAVPPRKPVVLNHVQRRLLEILCRQPWPLFAILDAAHTDRIVELFHGATEQYQSLYEGQSGADLANFAPYLVQLPPRSPLLRQLIQEGWGNGWGIYFTCEKSFAEVRRHLRHFLVVHTEAGTELYFRFYDPRILRVFLPTCTPDQAREFLGPIQGFFMEDDVPENLLRFLPPARAEKVSLRPMVRDARQSKVSR